MSDPTRHELADTAVARLVDALHDMRDALVKASLMLHDHRFDLDLTQRDNALEHSEKWLKKFRNSNLDKAPATSREHQEFKP